MPKSFRAYVGRVAAKKKRGRPVGADGKTVMVSLRLKPSAARALKAASRRRGVSQSAVVEAGLVELGELTRKPT